MLLSNEFLSQYPDQPEHMNELGSFVFYRTYSRWLPNQKRRETWKEAVARAVEYNVSIVYKQLKMNQYTITQQQENNIRSEAESLFDNIFNLRQFLSGRTHWVGGAETKVAEKFPLSNFNCAFVDILNWEDLGDLFYLLLVGTGVGFRCSKENIAKLSPIRTNFEITHSPYTPMEKGERLEKTRINVLDNGYAKIYIGDSKEGWVDALRNFLKFITEKRHEHIKYIKISYNSIRPKGERLRTFGGTASGPYPMQEMFEGIEKVLKGEIDDSLASLENFKNSPIWKQVRPVHIMDICNLIGNNVVVGGVRRTAELCMCDSDDEEIIYAKQGISNKLHLYHRFMSNNSVAFEEKPTREELHQIFQLIRQNGEPGFINMEAAKKRRPNAKGLNPCGEVILDSYGVCNLTTLNMMAFVNKDCLDYYGLIKALSLCTRSAIRMTCVDLELAIWDYVHKRDRLIGCSVTGWKDAMEALGFNQQQEDNLLRFMNDNVLSEAITYCLHLRIPMPLLYSTIKPEGTLSQVAGGVSSGLHASFAPYYIRRIRINANDPLVDVIKQLNWRINPEVGSTWENAKTFVIDFPVKSTATRTSADYSVEEQFDTYFQFQEHYTTHNSSNTIYVKDNEWDKAEQIVWDRWEDIIGITFLPNDGGAYELAPYEEITAEEYEHLKAKMLPFNPQLLQETEAVGEEALTGSDCEAGACPIR